MRENTQVHSQAEGHSFAQQVPEAQFCTQQFTHNVLTTPTSLAGKDMLLMSPINSNLSDYILSYAKMTLTRITFDTMLRNISEI